MKSTEKPLSFGISEVIPGTVEFTWQPLNESSVNYTVSCHSSRSSVRVMTSDLGIKVNTLTPATIYDCSLMSHTSDGEVPIDYYSFLTGIMARNAFTMTLSRLTFYLVHVCMYDYIKLTCLPVLHVYIYFT